eukprot:15380098-Alexandrium_andersonii.AAC.1
MPGPAGPQAPGGLQARRAATAWAIESLFSGPPDAVGTPCPARPPGSAPRRPPLGAQGARVLLGKRLQVGA